MRILVLTNLYPPNAMGGYELSCRDVVDSWRARGHDVSVLTTAGTLTGVVEPAGLEPHVRRELQWYWKDHAFVSPRGAARSALERHNHQSLRTAMQDVCPDVVSVWHMGGMSLSLLAALDDSGLPVVYNICDDWPYYGPKVDAWTRAWSRRPAWVAALGARQTGIPTAAADLDRHPAAFVSDFTRRRARERTRWSFADSVIVGSGVDTTDFPLAATVDQRPWRWELLGVGRIEPRKGFDTAVAALEHLPPEVHLRLAGVAEPGHLTALHEQARSVGASGRLHIEAVPRARLKDLYAQADVLLFPSRWEEPFGLVPLEAMTQATPVVATRQGGSAEFLVDGDNCLAVPPDDPLALAAAVQALAADAALRGRLATGGLLTAARFTVGHLAAVLEDLHLAAVRRDTPVAGS